MSVSTSIIHSQWHPVDVADSMYSSYLLTRGLCCSPCKLTLLWNTDASLMNRNSVNEDVIIRLKWGQTEYKGTLISVDSYMNVQLSNTEEFIDGKSTGALGQVLIR